MKIERTQLIVSIRTYRSKNGLLSYNQDGSIQNESNVMKLFYGTLEWSNFISACRVMGFIKYEVVKVTELVKEAGDVFDKETEKNVFHTAEYKDATAGHKEKIDKEINDAFHAVVEVKQTPEQKEIEALKAQVSNIAKAPVKEQPKKEVNDELQKARDEYQKAFNKNPHHKLGVEEIYKRVSKKRTN